MPITPPNLDDLRFDRIREDLVRRIPVHSPEWTDHNESDPGITLIELFAHLAEQVGYRLNLIPEKNHIELLKLLGVRLKTARAARTQLAFLLSDPAVTTSVVLPAGSRAKAKTGTPPPSFETVESIDIVPAEPNVLVTTVSEKLWDLGLLNANEDPPDPIRSRFHVLVWDGKKPKMKDMPLSPIEMFPDPLQTYLWVGLNFNPALDAGFLGVRVTLTVQLDDDEQPDLRAAELCKTPVSVEDAPPAVDWLYYFDAGAANVKKIPGRIDDSTERITRSGKVRFTIPFTMGPIPESMFKDVRAEVVLSPGEACDSLTTNLRTNLDPLDATAADYLDKLQKAMTKAVKDTEDVAANPQPAVPHPLESKFRDPAKMKGWLRIGPITRPAGAASPKLRISVFNAAAAINATTVTQELVGKGDGRPGQTYALGHTNVLAGSLQMAIQEDRDGLLIPWTVVDSLDPAGPFDRVVEVDYEAGILTFGDGIRGRIPALVPAAGNIVAQRYQHGGGKAGEVEVGAISALDTQMVGLAACTNFVKGAGGADAETLDEAKIRARKELSTRSRAVTAGDFEWIASQTPTVRVARVVVVPLRRPLQPGNCPPPPSVVRCKPDLPAGPAGLDESVIAQGAVSVVVVPDEDIAEPIPAPSFLRAVCEQLNRHRLVTTEVYVVPPQYVRLCNFRVRVKAKPGYTRTQLQDLVEARLTQYLHVLTGGEDSKGFPFGGQVHVADLVALVFRVEGIERVELLTAEFSRTKSNANPRQGYLVLCPEAADQFDRISLAPEETVSVDTTTFTLTTVP